MTIAMGFRVTNGVLICSDTEHSGGRLVGRERKVIPVVFPQGRALFSFSADNADLALATIQRCEKALQNTKSGLSSHSEMAELVERVTRAQYRKHVLATPDARGESIYQILAALWHRESGTALYSTWQGSIRRCDTYECVGSGFYLGKYLIHSMFDPTMDIDAVRLVATYVMTQVKDNVDGCGGRTHMIALYDDGTFEQVPWDETATLESGLRYFDARIRLFLFRLLSQTDAKFLSSIQAFAEEMQELRVELEITDEAKRAAYKKTAELREFFAKLGERSLRELTKRDPSTPPPSQE